ncbi:MAG: hypothetical protein CSA72_08830, partial [Rhodobacterales bacterium]
MGPLLVALNGGTAAPFRHIRGSQGGDTAFQHIEHRKARGADRGTRTPAPLIANPRDPWGIRVIGGSEFLATLGLGHARSYIEATLARLGVRFDPQHVSIGRADFCVDVLAPGFELVPKQFVMHSHANRADHMDEM